jgi:hypothetical protein
MPVCHERGTQGAGDLGMGRHEYLQSQPVAHEFDDRTIHGYTPCHGNGRLYTYTARHGCDTVHDRLADTVEYVFPLFPASHVGNYFTFGEDGACTADAYRFGRQQRTLAELLEWDLQGMSHGFQKTSCTGSAFIIHLPVR